MIVDLRSAHTGFPPPCKASPEKKEEEEPPVEAKVGDLVELFMGRGQVRGIRQADGVLEVWAVGWEMAGEQRARFFVPREAVKVVPTVYYKMNGERGYFLVIFLRNFFLEKTTGWLVGPLDDCNMLCKGCISLLCAHNQRV